MNKIKFSPFCSKIFECAKFLTQDNDKYRNSNDVCCSICGNRFVTVDLSAKKITPKPMRYSKL